MHHASVTVSDMERSLGFYRDLLGLQVVYDAEGGGPEISRIANVPGTWWRVVQLACAGCLVELIQYLSPPERVPYQARNNHAGASHVALVVDDLEAYYQHLTANGVVFNAPPYTLRGGDFDGWKVTYCRDPDGITVELIQRA